MDGTSSSSTSSSAGNTGGGRGAGGVPPPPPQQGGKAILRPRPDAAGRSGGGGEEGLQQQHLSLSHLDNGEMSKVRLTPRGAGGGAGMGRREDDKRLMMNDMNLHLHPQQQHMHFMNVKQDQMYYIKAGVGSGTIQREKLTAEQRMERPVSDWREKMSIEEQVLDYRHLWKRFGYTNR